MLYRFLWVLLVVGVLLLIHWTTPFGVIAGMICFFLVAGFFALIDEIVSPRRPE